MDNKEMWEKNLMKIRADHITCAVRIEELLNIIRNHKSVEIENNPPYGFRLTVSVDTNKVSANMEMFKNDPPK